MNPGPAGTICPLPNLMDSMLFPVDTDPHFTIHVPQKEDALCFNINEEPGVVLNLVQDPNTGTVTSHPLPSRAGPVLLCP